MRYGCWRSSAAVGRSSGFLGYAVYQKFNGKMNGVLTSGNTACGNHLLMDTRAHPLGPEGLLSIGIAVERN